MEKAEWYVDWFDSPYYHLLYNNRNDQEANFFIEKLCAKLNLQAHYKIWDLACGRGRHAVALNKRGFDVTGTDLSVNSIQNASRFCKKDLRFEEHDMRKPYKENHFHAVFNLFTSIGYFKNMEENFLVFENVAKSLKPGGEFVIDFFNAARIQGMPSTSYTEAREDIHFEITKFIKDKAIVKHIEFKAEDKHYYFEESVSLLDKSDFEKFAAKAGLSLHYEFGNYHLEPFDKTKSDRLILIFKK